MAEDAIFGAMTPGKAHRWIAIPARRKFAIDSGLPASHIGRRTAFTCPNQIWQIHLQVDIGIP
jgi:hypothetical protein